MIKNTLFIGYVITNRITRKQYIGISSKSEKHRWQTHMQDSKQHNSEYASHLHNAIKKHGTDVFKIKKIKEASSWKEICKWEIETIQKWNTKAPNGYNLTDGGEGAFGIKRTEAFKKKLSEKKKEYYKDPEKRREQAIRSSRRKCTFEARQQQSLLSKELWKTEKYRKKQHENTMIAWENEELKEKHKKSVRKATVENPIWLKTKREFNKKQNQSTEWKQKVKKGINMYLEIPGNKEKITKKRKEQAIQYWKNPHEERRRKAAELMSKKTKERLQNPEYQKWRKENPPGGKPVLFDYKYFRSMSEAARYFEMSLFQIERRILKNQEGCKKLEIGMQYDYEIKI